MSSIESTLLFGSSRLRNIENQAPALIEVAEANIQRLTTQIDELTRMRERERSVLARLRLMVLPIGRLPVELLVEVFKIAVHSPLSFDSPCNLSWARSSTESGSALRKVLNLSHVSSYWRQVVHSTPRLWAEAVVGVSFERELTDRYFDGLDSLLARSSPFPISISVTGEPNPQASTTATKTSQRLVRSLAPTAQRWKNLQIALGSIPLLQKLPRGTFEMLEHLHVHNSWAAPAEDPTLVFECSPHLRRLTVYSAHARTLHLLRLPWSRLTHLDVCEMSMEGCHTALLQCSSLVWAKIYTTYDWDSPSHSPIITLPFLGTLDVAFEGTPNWGEVHGVEAFLLPLALPLLKTLKLELDAEEGFWSTTVFSGFQSRSPNIEDLRLFYSGIESDELITLLRHSPALRSLQIQYSRECIDNEFLNAFRYDEEDSAPLVPKLENLTLIDVGPSFDNGSLEAAIRFRWWKEEGRVLPDGSSPRVSRLKTVSVTDMGFDQGIKTRMQELIDEGLQLVLD
ncbi:hypothetical protein C8R46DRAFT_136770 [Mycena filopes]|nr:hypothetical protein C8R46DRAFT_136770 [Mycena filopes]